MVGTMILLDERFNRFEIESRFSGMSRLLYIARPGTQEFTIRTNGGHSARMALNVVSRKWNGARSDVDRVFAQFGGRSVSDRLRRLK